MVSRAATSPPSSDCSVLRHPGWHWCHQSIPLLYHTCHNIPIITTSLPYHTTPLPYLAQPALDSGGFPPFFKHVNYLNWRHSQNIFQTFYRISIPEDLVILTDWNVSILSWHFATAKNVTEWFLWRQYSVEMGPKYAKRFMVEVASRKCFLFMASSKISAISVHAACIAGMPVFCVKGRHQWWGGV